MGWWDKEGEGASGSQGLGGPELTLYGPNRTAAIAEEVAQGGDATRQEAAETEKSREKSPGFFAPTLSLPRLPRQNPGKCSLQRAGPCVCRTDEWKDQENLNLTYTFSIIKPVTHLAK